MTEDKKVLIT